MHFDYFGSCRIFCFMFASSYLTNAPFIICFALQLFTFICCNKQKSIANWHSNTHSDHEAPQEKHLKKCIIIDTAVSPICSMAVTAKVKAAAEVGTHTHSQPVIIRFSMLHNCWKLGGNSDILNWCNKHLVRKLLHFTFKSDFISDYDHQFFFFSTTI